MTATNVPEGLVADALRFLTEPAFRESPDRFYEQLLNGHRVLPMANGKWLVSGHAEVRSVLRDDRFSRAACVGHEVEYLRSDPRPEVQNMAGCQAAMMLFTDPPEHTRIRKYYRAPFLLRVVGRRWTSYIDDLADELARSLPHDQVFDLKRDYALPIPERVICRILGAPLEDHRKWERWTEAILNVDRTGEGGGSSPAEAADAMQEFGNYFAELIQQRRDEPTDDLISELVNANYDGDRLSDAELIGNFILLIAAGHETTANSISTTVVHLMTNRDQWDQLIAGDVLAENAIEEVLRFDGAQRFVAPRVAIEDVQIGDHTIRAGEQVICVLHAANRDPEIFAQPQVFDISRDVSSDSSSHVAFGSGTHFCLGLHLARLELVAALKSLIRHHPALQLAVSVDQLESTPSPTVRGWKRVLCTSPRPQL